MNNETAGAIVGIGARRGVTHLEVSDAVMSGLREAGIDIDDVQIFASSRLKEDEPGIIYAAESLGRKIVFLGDETINMYTPPSRSEASRFGIVGVAEPCALALSEKKELILEKRKYGNVTIAIAR
ncbi:MAG TPA: cobalamin biosynthesis protein [Methanosarcinales archaeon]|nr:cobalamin biosynthesis protein [Methanosarcinales archaeon]